MRSLIVGSTSVIGKAIGRALAPLGEVRTAGRREADFAFDLSQDEAVALDGAPFDTVVLAAAAFGGDTPQTLIETELVNAVGTLRACHLAQLNGARHIILVSSIFAELAPGTPYFNAYSLSKRHAEELAALFCQQHGIELTILRPSQVYDASGACRKHQALLYVIAETAMAGNTVQLYGNNDVRRNYLFLDDLAHIVSLVAQRRVVGTFACVHPQSPRLSDIARAAFAASGHPADIRFLRDKPDIADMPIFHPDPALHQAIDYWPCTDIHTGMRLIHEAREVRV